MTREERCKLAIEKGITCNLATGQIFGIKGNELKSKHSQGYIRFVINFNGKDFMILGHQFIYYYATGELPENIDHINGVRDDNRIMNLRGVTQQQNTFNKLNTKGYHKRGNKFRAVLQIIKEYKHLGYYDTEEEARAAYLNAKEKYHII